MCFAKYASTSEPSARRKKYPPIQVDQGVYETFLRISSFLRKNGYEEMTEREEYFDIFAKKDGYEYSFVVVADQGKSMVQISVYKDQRFSKSKRLFKDIYYEMEEYLES